MRIYIEQTASRLMAVDIPDDTPLDKIREVADNTPHVNDDVVWEMDDDCTSFWRPIRPDDLPQGYLTATNEKGEETMFIEV